MDQPEQSFQTKNSPYSVMDYNGLLMNLIHYVYYNMQGGGTGFMQAHNLRETLKPKYQDELKEFFDQLDDEYNNYVARLERRERITSLKSDRFKLRGTLGMVQQQYSRRIVREVIATLDRHGALEFTQQILQGGKDFQKVMGLR